MQGKANGKLYAVKLYDNRKAHAVDAYFHEKACLLALKCAHPLSNWRWQAAYKTRRTLA